MINFHMIPYENNKMQNPQQAAVLIHDYRTLTNAGSRFGKTSGYLILIKMIHLISN